jgi:hypothetical protein
MALAREYLKKNNLIRRRKETLTLPLTEQQKFNPVF